MSLCHLSIVKIVAFMVFKWNFGDGTATGTNQFATHVLATSGIYSWQVVATVGAVSATNTGSIAISAPAC